MWIKVSRIILRNKYALLGILLLITLFFGYHARQVEMSYEPAPLLPQKDKAYTDYISFTEVFGEEGNLIILGVRDPDFSTLTISAGGRSCASAWGPLTGLRTFSPSPTVIIC